MPSSTPLRRAAARISRFACTTRVKSKIILSSSVKGLPAQWVALPAVIPMAPGERKTVTMTIEPRLSESRVGRYSFRVEAVSQEQPHLDRGGRGDPDHRGF